ncbi:MAG: DUF4386 domain-containing protein [Mycetocola sp.]
MIMLAAVAAGVLLIVLPIAFNAAFVLLAKAFDYPDILRRPTAEILSRFRAGGSRLVLLWWAFALTAVLLAPLAVLVALALRGANDALLATGATLGVLAATVQFLGLVRWPFLVPYLARQMDDTASSPTRKEAIDVVFQSFHRYLGVAVGEHLGYLFTGAWSVLVGAAMIQAPAGNPVIGIAGMVIGAALVMCSLEFVGPAEPAGWTVAARVTPIAYIAWSLWLLAAGVWFVI